MYNAGDIIRHNAREALSVSPDVPVLEALRYMAGHNIGAVLVLEQDELVGIFSERDYARKVVLQNRSSATTRVRDVMVSQLITVETTVTTVISGAHPLVKDTLKNIQVAQFSDKSVSL